MNSFVKSTKIIFRQVSNPVKAFALFYISLTSTPNLQDDFNLTGLNILVPYYDYALDMVLDVEMPMEDSLTEEQQEIVESAAVRVCFVLR